MNDSNELVANYNPRIIPGTMVPVLIKCPSVRYRLANVAREYSIRWILRWDDPSFRVFSFHKRNGCEQKFSNMQIPRVKTRYSRPSSFSNQRICHSFLSVLPTSSVSRFSFFSPQINLLSFHYLVIFKSICISKTRVGLRKEKSFRKKNFFSNKKYVQNFSLTRWDSNPQRFAYRAATAHDVATVYSFSKITRRNCENFSSVWWEIRPVWVTLQGMSPWRDSTWSNTYTR